MLDEKRGFLVGSRQTFLETNEQGCHSLAKKLDPNRTILQTKRFIYFENINVDLYVDLFHNTRVSGDPTAVGPSPVTTFAGDGGRTWTPRTINTQDDSARPMTEHTYTPAQRPRTKGRLGRRSVQWGKSTVSVSRGERHNILASFFPPRTDLKKRWKGPFGETDSNVSRTSRTRFRCLASLTKTKIGS